MKTDLRDQLRPHIERLGQSEAARRSGIHQSTISAWLAGKRNLPMERQIDLANAMDRDVIIRLQKRRTPKNPQHRG